MSGGIDMLSYSAESGRPSEGNSTRPTTEVSQGLTSDQTHYATSVAGDGEQVVAKPRKDKSKSDDRRTARVWTWLSARGDRATRPVFGIGQVCSDRRGKVERENSLVGRWENNLAVVDAA
jgi:hypothetical protein